MKTCLRCNEEKKVSVIGFALANFICDTCRNDNNAWHMGHDSTIKDMEYQLAEPENPSGAYLSQATRNKNVKQWQSSKMLEEKFDESHRNHLVLGHFCWNCNVRTSSFTPGYDRVSYSDGPRIKQKVKDVVWMDGGHDDSRACSMCLSHKCEIPVHTDHYREIGTNGVKAEEN